MAASRTRNLKRFLIILTIPVFWSLFSQLPIFDNFFRPLENLAMDWRFRVRGPLDVPEVKVVYADIDGKAIAYMGERPWSRTRFGLLGEILFDAGKAKAIAYDIIFSGNSSSEIVPLDKVREEDERFGQFISQRPNVVLAANYTGVNLPLTLEERKKDLTAELIVPHTSHLPLVEQPKEGNPEAKRPTPATSLPEMPTFPIIDYGIGQVGLIDLNPELSAGPVPRYIPLFAHAEGPYYTLYLLEGYKRFYDTVDDSSFEVFGENVFIIDKNGDHLGSYPYLTEQTFYHMSIELALQYLGLTQEQVEITSDALTIRDEEGQVLIEVPLIEGQFAEVNWFSPWQDAERNPRASIAEIFQQYDNLRDGKGEIKAEAEQFFKMFNDAIVLIGPVDHTLQDLAPTPFDSSPVPKVGMHGNMIKTLFSGLYISRLDTGWQVALIFLLTGLVALLGLYSGKLSILAKVASFVVLFAYILGVFAAFSLFHLVIPLIAPVASAITTTTAGALIQLLLEERQKGRIKGMFGTYLSPELVNQMVESGEEPQLGGEDARITAFFSDVQSFSAFSELLEPAQLVHLMNEYLTAMTDLLMQEGAYVDKYIGDAIVAMFNAPVQLKDHAYHACVAAARIQQRQLELRQKWAQEGDKWPDIVGRMQTRIGLNTGNATVGNMGSENRFNYTMMGDTVNLAARCESGAKTAGVYTLATAETRAEALQTGEGVLFRFLDKWQVKGRSQPVDMYEVVGLKEALPEHALECVRTYEAGLDKYFAQDWEGAAALFQRSAELEPNRPGETPGVTTNPSLVLLARCQHMQQNPPGPHWDGVYVMQTK